MISSTMCLSSSPIPLPNPAAFEDKLLVKKQKRSLDGPSTPPTPKCPSTPIRSPYSSRMHLTNSSTHNNHMYMNMNNSGNNNGAAFFAPSEKQHCYTELKRCRCSSENFTFISELGSGSFGTVYKAISNKDQGQPYAIKKSKKPIWNMHHRSQYLAEITHAKCLTPHPSITAIHDAWEEGGHIYTQMELCRASLKDILANDPLLSEPIVWQYVANIIHGLNHVHANKIIHLDIKPENLLLGFDNTLKITDFGISTILGTTAGYSEGDKKYMAPELLNDQLSQAADIFSVGITLYEVVTGYDLPGEGLWWRNLREGNIEFPADTEVSEEMQSLIREMMHPEPSKRPTASLILSHPKVAPFVPVETPPRKKVTRKLFI